jgi:NADH-quinone oxidoreductase subunit N
MNVPNILLAAPEIWVFGMAYRLLVDLFLLEQRRDHPVAGDGDGDFAAFLPCAQNMFTMEPLSRRRSAVSSEIPWVMLKLFTYFIVALVFVYAKSYLRQFNMFRADFYTLALFALLGIMLLISANSLVMIYLGLELTSLSTYALVAYDRDSSRGSEAAMKYFVLVPWLRECCFTACP